MTGPTSSLEAYVKTILHCFKHSTGAVSGLLVGKTWRETEGDATGGGGTSGGSGGGSGSASEQTYAHITDAIPLAHSMLLTAPHPVLEIALMQIHSVCSSKGLSVLGYYVANERRDDHAIHEHTKKVVKHIIESSHVSHSTEFVLWHIDNTLITPGGEAVAVQCHVASPQASKHRAPSYTQPYSLQFGKWNAMTCRVDRLASPTPVTSSLREAVQSFLYSEVVDFEDHLENVSLDYFNENMVLPSVSGSSSPLAEGVAQQK